MNREIRVVGTPEELSLAAALQFVYRAKETMLEKRRFTVALCGGSTLRKMYSRLAGDPSLNRQLSWRSVHFFWTDERHVPPNHPDSHYKMAYDHMISKLRPPRANVHRIKGESRSAGRAAAQYERHLREFFMIKAEQLPRFDLVLLGMGVDGHIASIFPRSNALRERKRLVIADGIGISHLPRITMTAAVLKNAAFILFLVTGEDKAITLNEVLYGDYRRERFPAQRIRPVKGKLLWLVDKDAARLLPVRENKK